MANKLQAIRMVSEKLPASQLWMECTYTWPYEQFGVSLLSQKEQSNRKEESAKKQGHQILERMSWWGLFQKLLWKSAYNRTKINNFWTMYQNYQ